MKLSLKLRDLFHSLREKLSTVIQSLSVIERIFLLLIVVVALLVRLYNLRDTMVFLGDEGRDALVVKRMLVDGDLTLLGPTASVGGFYLGPMYYYMLLPFMALFGLDPVSGAVMVALFGSLTVILIFLLVYHLFGTWPAFVASGVYTILPGVVRMSRSSWNPNPIPFFVISLMLLLWRFRTTKSVWIALYIGLCLGILVQLHYLALVVVPFTLLSILVWAEKKRIARLAMVLVGGFLGVSPLFLFELRHNWLNTKAVFEFLTRPSGATRSTSLLELGGQFIEANRFLLESIFGAFTIGWPWTILTYIFLVIVLLSVAWGWRTKSLRPPIRFLVGFWLLTTLTISLYSGQWFYHYFAPLFVAPVLLLGMVMIQLPKKLLPVASLVIIGVAWIGLWSKLPSWEQGSKLLQQTQEIASEVVVMSEDQPYNFALITDGNSDHAYRFFLETAGAKPVPLEESVTPQLIVVCEKQPEPTCAPLGNPLWEVAGFGRAEIVETRTVGPGITLYKLIHHSESQDRIGRPAPQG